MPRKNTQKTYIENGYYHVYNRGNNQQRIFIDPTDYHIFINILKTYLTPPPPKTRYPKKNYHNQITLHCYCLMPNHFHLVVKQRDKHDISSFMSSLSLSFSSWFSHKYQHLGRLFESRYKAILIDNDAYLLYLSKYIHLNPRRLYPDLSLAFSSYSNYLGLSHKSWLETKHILDYFHSPQTEILLKQNSYKNFVEDTPLDKNLISHLLLQK